jgi:mannosyltransferase OCH1-like enzyme
MMPLDDWLISNPVTGPIFIGFCLFGILTAIVANDRGHSPLGFFLLTFILGPFALMTALLIEDRGEQKRPDLPSFRRKQKPRDEPL